MTLHDRDDADRWATRSYPDIPSDFSERMLETIERIKADVAKAAYLQGYADSLEQTAKSLIESAQKVNEMRPEASRIK